MSKEKLPPILVTGATGTIGSELVRNLSAMGLSFRVMVRSLHNSEPLHSLAGAEVVVGDLNDAESVAGALNGIERAFLLTNSSEHAEMLQTHFVDIAARMGVQHIVKLSQLAAATDSPVRFLRYHAAVEQKIRETGMSFTFLRPNLFMQGLLAFREPIIKQGKFFAPAGEAKISMVDIRDIAAVAAEALKDGTHEGKVYDLTGQEALTHQEMAQQMSEAIGREVKFIDVSPDDMRQALLSVGFPLWQADGLIEDYAHYTRGEASAISAAVLEVTAKHPRNFRSFVRDYAESFR